MRRELRERSWGRSKTGQSGAPRAGDSRAEKKLRAARVTGACGGGRAGRGGHSAQPTGAGSGGGHGERSLRAPWKPRGRGRHPSLDSAHGPRRGRRPTASRGTEGRGGMSEAGLRRQRRPRRAALPGVGWGEPSKNLPVPGRSVAARGSRARGRPSRAAPP